MRRYKSKEEWADIDAIVQREKAQGKTVTEALKGIGQVGTSGYYYYLANNKKEKPKTTKPSNGKFVNFIPENEGQITLTFPSGIKLGVSSAQLREVLVATGDIK